MNTLESATVGFVGGILGAAILFFFAGHLTVVTGVIGGALGGFGFRWAITSLKK